MDRLTAMLVSQCAAQPSLASQCSGCHMTCPEDVVKAFLNTHFLWFLFEGRTHLVFLAGGGSRSDHMLEDAKTGQSNALHHHWVLKTHAVQEQLQHCQRKQTDISLGMIPEVTNIITIQTDSSPHRSLCSQHESSLYKVLARSRISFLTDEA